MMSNKINHQNNGHQNNGHQNNDHQNSDHQNDAPNANHDNLNSGNSNPGNSNSGNSNSGNPSTWVLYTTIGCHLCRAAYQHLLQVAGETVFIEEIDIFSDEILRDTYWDKVPVVRNEHGETLAYPFDENCLRDWLNAASHV